MVVATAAAPKCFACDVERQMKTSVPITDDYVVTSYECPNCKTILRLVEWQDRPPSHSKPRN